MSLTLLTSCAVGPSRRPPLATSGELPTPTGATTSAVPLGPGGKGQTAVDLRWGECFSSPPTRDAKEREFQLECAELRVPQAYAGGRGVLRLKVARARLDGTPQQAPPIVITGSQPTVSGPEHVAELAGRLPDDILANHTVISVRVRGVDDLDCFDRRTRRFLDAPPHDPRQSSEADQIVQLAQNLTYDCQDNFGAEITEFNTTAAADDLDTLRASLELERLTFVGTGYGALLGTVYAGRYPGRIDKVVLDAPFDPAATPTDRQAEIANALEVALDDFAAWCTALPQGCPTGARPRQAVEKLIARLGTTGDMGRTSVFNAGSLLLVLSATLHDPAQHRALAEALAAGMNGDFVPLSALAEPISISPSGQRQWESRLTIGCNDSAQRLTIAGLREAAQKAGEKAPLFGPFEIGQAGLCATWPTSLSALSRQNAIGAPPILVIGASGDSIAPFIGVKSVTSQLASASLITWQSSEHGSLGRSDCVAQAVTGYLNDGTMPAAGLLCPP